MSTDFSRAQKRRRVEVSFHEVLWTLILIPISYQATYNPFIDVEAFESDNAEDDEDGVEYGRDEGEESDEEELQIDEGMHYHALMIGFS